MNRVDAYRLIRLAVGCADLKQPSSSGEGIEKTEVCRVGSHGGYGGRQRIATFWAEDAPGIITKVATRDSTACLLKISRLSGRLPMPQQVRGVVVDPAAPGKLSIKPVELRDPDRDEVAVRVTAISLNRGETRRAVQQAEPGWRPGWDFAGVAETAAAVAAGPNPAHAWLAFCSLT
jgi:hypothetical protein